jgi:hypothetical protein
MGIMPVPATRTATRARLERPRRNRDRMMGIRRHPPRQLLRRPRRRLPARKYSLAKELPGTVPLGTGPGLPVGFNSGGISGPIFHIADRSSRLIFNHSGCYATSQCCELAPFSRDSQGIPESRRRPILAGMSQEERVSDARHALLFESRLDDSQENPSKNAMVRCRTGNAQVAQRHRFAVSYINGTVVACTTKVEFSMTCTAPLSMAGA